MSCNGCRVLRKGCSENCILRSSLQWIDGAEAQGHATVFVAKFFGRAGLISFLSAVPDNQRPSLFQSLLFEAAGRTVNPVNGAVGLLWTGNWNVCQAAVDTVLRGGTLQPILELLGLTSTELDESSEVCTDTFNVQDPSLNFPSKVQKRKRSGEQRKVKQFADLDLSLNPGFPPKVCSGLLEKRRPSPGTPSRNSEESVTTAWYDQSGFGPFGDQGLDQDGETKLLNLFN